jgi:hypothetical protein
MGGLSCKICVLKPSLSAKHVLSVNSTRDKNSGT